MPCSTVWLRSMSIQRDHSALRLLRRPEAAGIDRLANALHQTWLRGAAALQPAEKSGIVAVVTRSVAQDVQPQRDIAVKDANEGVIAQKIGHPRRHLHVFSQPSVSD